MRDVQGRYDNRGSPIASRSIPRACAFASMGLGAKNEAINGRRPKRVERALTGPDAWPIILKRPAIRGKKTTPRKNRRKQASKTGYPSGETRAEFTGSLEPNFSRARSIAIPSPQAFCSNRASFVPQENPAKRRPCLQTQARLARTDLYRRSVSRSGLPRAFRDRVRTGLARSWRTQDRRMRAASRSR